MTMALAFGLAVAAGGIAPPPIVTLGEARAGDAMALAGRLLPAEVRSRIVEGSMRRQLLPGQTYWAGYRTAPAPAARDVCTRTAYSVRFGAFDAGEDAPDTTPLALSDVETGRLVAIVYPARYANRATCAATRGYVMAQGARQLIAYRGLIAAMRRADGSGSLPFALLCDPADDPACHDARRALATLPLNAIYDVSVAGEHDGTVDPTPVVDGAYSAEASFGMSGEDGRSWRLGWSSDGRHIASIAMHRVLVHYH